MKNSYNMTPMVKYLGIMTGRQFNLEYNTMARSRDMLPKASVCNPIKDANGCTLYADDKCTEPLVDCYIFYDLKEEDERTLSPDTGKVTELAIPKRKWIV